MSCYVCPKRDSVIEANNTLVWYLYILKTFEYYYYEVKIV